MLRFSYLFSTCIIIYRLSVKTMLRITILIVT